MGEVSFPGSLPHTHVIKLWLDFLLLICLMSIEFLASLMAQWLPQANADLGLIPGLGRSPREGNGKPLQYSCLVNPMERGVWQVTVHSVTKSQTGLSLNAHARVRTYTHTQQQITNNAGAHYL